MGGGTCRGAGTLRNPAARCCLGAATAATGSTGPGGSARSREGTAGTGRQVAGPPPKHGEGAAAGKPVAGPPPKTCDCSGGSEQGAGIGTSLDTLARFTASISQSVPGPRLLVRVADVPGATPGATPSLPSSIATQDSSHWYVFLRRTSVFAVRPTTYPRGGPVGSGLVGSPVPRCHCAAASTRASAS